MTENNQNKKVVNSDIKKEIQETEGLEALKEKLEKCEKQNQEYLDGWKRAKADFLNYKKEETARLENFIKFSNESLLHELINVLDSFELSRLSAKNEKEGKEMMIIFSQFQNILRRFGLEKIPIKIGSEFDPGLAEAVSEVDSDKAAHAVVEEVSSGYALNGKIIRPAKVKISKGQSIK